MKKSFLALLAGFVLFAALGCSLVNGSLTYVVEPDGKIAIFGKVYNGLTRSEIAVHNNKTFKATLTYANREGWMSRVTVQTDDNNYYYFSGIPTDTPFRIEVAYSDTNGSFLPFFHENSTGISDALTTSGTFTQFDPGKSLLKNVYLFPGNVNPGTVTLQVYDASNGAAIASSGTVLLFPTSVSTLDNNDSNNILPNGAGERVEKITATLTNGVAEIPGSSLTLGVTYTAEIFGVTGYEIYEGTIGTMNTASATTKRIELTQNVVSSTPIVIARSDFDAYGSQIASNGSITLTFDRNIELDPTTQYTALITGITTNDTDDDGNTTTLAAFTGNPNNATPVASNHLTVTATNNTLTIAVKSGYLSLEDTADELSLVFDRTTIAIREAGTTGAFFALNAVTWNIGAWNSGNVIVRYFSALE